MQRLIDGEVERAVPLFETAISKQVEAAARAVRNGTNVAEAVEGESVKEAYRQAWGPAALLFAGRVYNAIDRARKDFGEEQYSVWERAVTEHLALEGGNQIVLIDNYTKEWVRGTVQAILSNPEFTEAGTDAIAKELIGRWEELSRNRALRIAQTEMNAAANWGSLQAATAAGMTRKYWITAGDRRVRDSHGPLNGETVPIDQPFSNGLMHPSQPGGPAGEVINCRCQVGYLP